MTAFATTARSARRTRQALWRLGALALVAMLATAFTAAPTLAAKGGNGGGITGTIELAGSAAAAAAEDAPAAPMSYGDNASFDASVSGKMAPSGFVYIRVHCMQGNDVVYVASSRDLDHEFSLVDQDGDNLEWDGNEADCSGWLIYHDGKKRNPTILKLDATDFAVAGA